MFKPTRILVPTDMSDHADKAVRQAIDISKQFNAELLMLHVIRDPVQQCVGDYCISQELVDQLQAEMLEGARAGIKNQVAKFSSLNDISFTADVKIGVPYAEILSKVLPLLNDRLTEQRIHIELDIDDDLPPLWVDQELLRNCILNFINNAAQAMNDGGVIHLGAALDESGERIQLTFVDQGSGILPEDIAKIFQPYFTTKDVGIGLGLAITERIIKEHGGEIIVSSSEGNGTTFTVTLPGQA